jgi:hypothetical protein
MKELEFDKEMMEIAMEWSKSHVRKFHNNILSGEAQVMGSFAGRLGELALSKHLGVEIADKKDYDMMVSGKRLEVKTKQRAVKPRSDYIVQVAVYSKHQRPDAYAFLSLQYGDRDSGGKYIDPQHLWLCGFKTTEDYFSESEMWPKGYVDPNMPSYTTMSDMHVMKIDDLNERL